MEPEPSGGEATALVPYDEMCRAIEVAHDLFVVKEIYDKAAAIEFYQKLAGNPEPERQACNIRMRALRRLGELTGSMEKARGGRPPKTSSSAEQVSGRPPTLADLGIARKQSMQAQQLAAVPQPEFEAALAAPARLSANRIITGSSVAPKRQPPTREDRFAQYLWMTLANFEREGLLALPAAELVARMTAEKQAEVRQRAPLLIRWLQAGGLDDE